MSAAVLHFPPRAKPRPVETALDRLVSRLGEGASAEVQAAVRDVTDKDAAYGRMIEASIAGDDAAYEAAKANFWGGDAA